MDALINLLTYTWLALMIAGGIMSVRNAKRESRDRDAHNEARDAAVDRLNAAGDKIEMQIITREAFNDRYREYLSRIDRVVKELEC